MNAKIKIFNKKEISNEQVADITFKSSNLKGIHLGKKTVANMIDEIPIFSILATFAEGNSSFIGGNELKNKESNRIKSLYEGLTACKIKVKKKMDGLQITGNGKNNIFVNAKIKTYYDHRIAMAFLVMGLASKKKIIVIQDADLEYNPKDLNLMINKIQKENVDVVFGNRFSKKENKYHYFFYALGNYFLSKWISLLFKKKILDVAVCYKMFKRDVIKGLNLNSKDFMLSEIILVIEHWIKTSRRQIDGGRILIVKTPNTCSRSLPYWYRDTCPSIYAKN